MEGRSTLHLGHQMASSDEVAVWQYCSVENSTKVRSIYWMHQHNCLSGKACRKSFDTSSASNTKCVGNSHCTRKNQSTLRDRERPTVADVVARNGAQLCKYEKSKKKNQNLLMASSLTPSCSLIRLIWNGFVQSELAANGQVFLYLVAMHLSKCWFMPFASKQTPSCKSVNWTFATLSGPECKVQMHKQTDRQQSGTAAWFVHKCITIKWCAVALHDQHCFSSFSFLRKDQSSLTVRSKCAPAKQGKGKKSAWREYENRRPVQHFNTGQKSAAICALAVYTVQCCQCCCCRPSSSLKRGGQKGIFIWSAATAGTMIVSFVTASSFK